MDSRLGPCACSSPGLGAWLPLGHAALGSSMAVGSCLTAAKVQHGAVAASTLTPSYIHFKTFNLCHMCNLIMTLIAAALMFAEFLK